MDTTRLSDVITGWGGKLTTCSRMSTLVRTASRNGMSRFRPGFRVRWYLPSRSTTSIRCCGTTRTDRNSTVTTNIATIAASTRRTTSPGFTYVSVPPHHRRCPLDFDHPDMLAGLELLCAVEGP